MDLPGGNEAPYMKVLKFHLTTVVLKPYILVGLLWFSKAMIIEDSPYTLKNHKAAHFLQVYKLSYFKMQLTLRLQHIINIL